MIRYGGQASFHLSPPFPRVCRAITRHYMSLCSAWIINGHRFIPRVSFTALAFSFSSLWLSLSLAWRSFPARGNEKNPRDRHGWSRTRNSDAALYLALFNRVARDICLYLLFLASLDRVIFMYAPVNGLSLHISILLAYISQVIIYLFFFSFVARFYIILLYKSSYLPIIEIIIRHKNRHRSDNLNL